MRLSAPLRPSALRSLLPRPQSRILAGPALLRYSSSTPESGSKNKRTPPLPSDFVHQHVPPASPMYEVYPETAPGIHAGVNDNPRVLLKPNNLFHPMEASPVRSMRQRAEYIKKNAYCPHPEHRASASPQHIRWTCPDCGVPTYCSKEHWEDDYENHLLICDTLKEANEDDHDLRSGRFFPEFEYPGEQLEEQLVNFTNWDTFLYTRDFRAIDDDRQMRQVTRLLTYPATIASVLHELSPYNARDRLTHEGLRSLSGMLCLPRCTTPINPSDPSADPLPQLSAIPSIPS